MTALRSRLTPHALYALRVLRAPSLARSSALVMLVALSALVTQNVTQPQSAHAASRTARAASPITTPLTVSGAQLLAGGQPVTLHGVNRSGSEYACVQGWGIFDGPSDAASVAAIASWGATLVRVPLNEDCWLGINGVNSAYADANYQSAIEQYVALLHQYGIRAELSLIWGAPGSYQATYQSGAPDEDHSPAFWSSLASAFKGDNEDLLAPWGETIVNWNCFQNGGVCEATYGSNNAAYNVAGMQQAVTTMRNAGYTGVISIPCIDYANDCNDAAAEWGADQGGGDWLSHEPSDPLHQLVAEAHVYGKNVCDTTACLNDTMANTAAHVPMLFAETGETYDGSECGSGYEQAILNWADAHNVSWAAWTWDLWGDCSTLSLISNNDGTVNAGAYPAYIHTHLLSYSGGATPPAPTSTPTQNPSPTATDTPAPTPPSSPTPGSSPTSCSGGQSVSYDTLTATPAPVYQGQATKITTTYSAACAESGDDIRFSLTNSSGAVLWTRNVANVALKGSGVQQSSVIRWTVPMKQAPGSYTLSAQAFNASGDPLPAANGSTASAGQMRALTINASTHLSSVPCTVVINGQAHTGHCTGVLTP